MAERRADHKNRYRDRISGETEEAFGLENVRGLDRPMASGPGDIPIGKDELGNTIYRTVLGTQYTVRRATPEESETTRTKVENWVDEGMPLPSKDEALEMAKALPGAMYDSAQNMLEGTATLGEVVGVAPGMQAAGAGAKVPKGALRTGGGRNTENPKYNPLFREEVPTPDPFEQTGDELPTGWSIPADPTTEFYNPLRTTVENMDFGKQGLKGETIASFLEKRAPKVRKSLLRSADSGRGIFKAGQRYTQEEALNILDENFGRVFATTLSDGAQHYPDAQRMNFLENDEKDYGELVINQDRTVNFKANSQHYDDNTLAHARFSVRDDGAGGDMLVVEELQSDLVQKGFEASRGKTEGVTQTQAAKQIAEAEGLPKVLVDVISVNDRANDLPSEERLWEVVDGIDEYLGRPGFSREEGEFFKNNIRDFLIRKVTKFIRSDDPQLEELWGRSYETSQKNKPVSAVSLPPIDSTTEFVRPLIHALMVEAKNRGIDKVVIPNSDAFIEARKNQLGGDESDIASTKKAFKQTYDDAVDKVLKELDREMGVDVGIEKISLRGGGDRHLGKDLMDFDQDLYDAVSITLNQFQTMGPEEWVDRTGTTLGVYETWKKALDEINTVRPIPQYPSRMITLGNIPKGKIRFAEGGLVDDPMEKQMKFAFMNEGGMIDDGATVEPTTGNEVPPGSTKEEVADTIDAKLSVGEYVVPADVVQYYGVAYFEKLRKKAKEGLAEMEANGRIGGDPEEDELPFSDEELEAEDMEEDGAQGFAEGGLAQMAGLTNTGIETVNYVGPDGSKIPILFMNGQPIQQVPQGYVPEGQAKEQKAAFKSVRPGVTKDEGERPLNTMEAKPINEWAVEDFERYSNSQSVMDIATKLPALLGPGGAIMGGLMNKAYQMQGAKALEEIDNRLAMPDLDEQSRQRLETVKQNLSSRESEGGGLFNSILGGGLGESLTKGGGLLESLFGGGVKTTSEMPSNTPSRASTSTPRIATSGGSSSAGLAPTSSPRPQANPTRSSTTSQAPKNSTPAQKETYSSSGRNNSQQVSGDPRNFAEGGFVKRRNKKT